MLRKARVGIRRINRRIFRHSHGAYSRRRNVFDRRAEPCCIAGLTANTGAPIISYASRFQNIFGDVHSCFPTAENLLGRTDQTSAAASLPLLR